MKNPVQFFSLLLITVGLFLRVDYFIENRSLRVDEAAYFDCLVSRTPQEVLLNQKYNFYSPSAPIGFSIVERLIINYFGSSEYALRIIPLIFSIAGLFLFYFLVSQYSFSWATPLATGLFAFSDRLLFYSADMHPYSTEVFFAILLLWIFNCLEKKGLDSNYKILFILISVVSVWFSYTAVFVLSAFAATSLISAIDNKQWQEMRHLFMVHGLWAISFICVYVYSIHPILQTGITYAMWQGYFINGKHDVISCISWGFKIFYDIFKDPLNIIFPPLGILLFWVGGNHLFQNNRKQFLFLSIPFILALLAAFLQKYPLSGRVALFLMPCFLIFISIGTDVFVNRLKFNLKLLCTFPLLITLFILPLTQTASNLAFGWDNEEARTAISYLKDNLRENDIILMNNEARFSFGYYMGYYHINMKDRWVGRIWDDLFIQPHDRLQARCVFEKFLMNQAGFLTGVSLDRNRPVYKIYTDQWLNLGNKRVWLLLIFPSKELQILLRTSLKNQPMPVQEIRFKGAYLYLIKNQRFPTLLKGY